MKSKILIITLILLATSNCGFNIVNQNYLKEYKFSEVNIIGEKRVSYLLRNKLKIANENASKSIKLNIVTKKSKLIKEKNIQNEITKHEIIISAEIDFNVIENDNSGKLFISKSGVYNVGNKYSETLNSEKKLIKNLINDISKQILKNLQINLDEL